MPTLFVTVPKEHVELIREVFSGAQLTDRSTWLPGTVTASYERLGELPPAPVDSWVERGVAHDLHTRPTREIDYGHRTAVRFTIDGQFLDYRLKPNTKNPPINELVRILDAPQRPAVKLAILDKFIRDYKHKHVPLPWDNQFEYGKRFMARQLLKFG